MILQLIAFKIVLCIITLVFPILKTYPAKVCLRISCPHRSIHKCVYVYFASHRSIQKTCLCICCITREIPNRYGLPNLDRHWGKTTYCKQSVWGGCVAEKRGGHHPPTDVEILCPSLSYGSPHPKKQLFEHMEIRWETQILYVWSIDVWCFCGGAKVV